MSTDSMLDLTDHQRAIIGAVLAKPAIRRTEISSQLGISAQTTMRAVLPLIEVGALQETQITSGGRGKPASSLTFVKGAMATLGISIASDRIRVEFCDLAGNQLVSQSSEKPYQSAAEQLIELDGLLNASQALLPKTAILVSVGVSIQGYFLDRGTRFTAKIDPSGWAKFDLQAHLFARFGVPVKLMNDGKTLASSLILIAPYQNFVCMHLGSGIGGGIVCGGQLVMGANGNAGEIGSLFPQSQNRPIESAFLIAAGIGNWADWVGFSGLSKGTYNKFSDFLDHAGAKIADALEKSLSILDFEAVYICSRMPADVLEVLCDRIHVAPLGTNLVGQSANLRNPAPIIHPFHVPYFAPLACRMARDIFLSSTKIATA